MPEHILQLSYGKESAACLGAIKHLGLPLDRIVHAEVWATDTIPADLPLMVEFKKKADAIIKDRFGIEVEHIKAKTTYEREFYRIFADGKRKGTIYGFPFLKGPWCNSRLKVNVLNEVNKNAIQYLGIAANEPLRVARFIDNPKIIMPLYELGWESDLCGLWCRYSDLLSPTYEDACRGGCWFCHNQSAEQLRLLRRNHPDLWALLLKWDSDSPVSFKPDGTTVHDFDKRFQMEDEGIILPNDSTFRWKQVHGKVDVQMKFF